ncbi:MAG: ribulose-phosphate 3-epimerase [Gammaproteobacteria bacterium]|nr:ribulose-phosphate 3-epimerase [Gammaproteobacteria bacterium]MDE0443310.1 ribulose-phosphate 3-epimerase [Gammaproteobacteria bacterium]
MEPWIAPSILAADFAKLGQEVDDVVAAGADAIHFDVMDNHYVPNLSVGPLVLESLRSHGVAAPVDVHLMVKPVDDLIVAFADAGADIVSFHPEASEHPHRSLGLVRERGAKAGLVFNPGTPVALLEPLIDAVDLVLIMSVNPGFGGQAFLPSSLDKVRAARKAVDSSGHEIRLEIDGGIKVDNIADAAAAGADMFVAGSAIFGVPVGAGSRVDDYRAVIGAMRDELAAPA